MLQYYPMPEHVRKQCNYRYSYTVIVNLFTSKDGIKDYINKNVRINNDEELGSDELTQRAANVVHGLIETCKEFEVYDLVQVAGITFANAYDRELKL
ncbi:hypothetical protein [Paenibacillus illinoisensis]|uniref:hypothetical protein n=1 Tax=Paenibacillus illinoisensis TaxID=59845 RepID=UPI003D2D8EAA